MFALILSTFSTANSRTEFHLGWEVSKGAQRAMPLAQCIWRVRYPETLAFVNELERGMKAKAALERLAKPSDVLAPSWRARAT
jgi:hypothetical protein